MTRRFVPVDVAAVSLGVSPAGVRQMFHRRQLTRYGTARRALVDLLECERLRCGDAA